MLAVRMFEMRELLRVLTVRYVMFAPVDTFSVWMLLMTTFSV